MKTELLGYSCVFVVEGPFLTRETEYIKCGPKKEGTKKEEKN
jgi:hypothetical protein